MLKGEKWGCALYWGACRHSVTSQRRAAKRPPDYRDVNPLLSDGLYLSLQDWRAPTGGHLNSSSLAENTC